MQHHRKNNLIRYRFDGFLPIVVDVETGGGNPQTDALLEVAAIVVEQNFEGRFYSGDLYHCHVKPFEGSHLNPESLAVNHITDPYHPFRFAIDEKEALEQLFDFVYQAVQKNRCRRAILVGHNAHFDLSFIHEAAKRCQIKKIPFHTYTVFDTATLGGFIYGKTVLAKALMAARIPFDRNEAHSAIYDTERTAELFCKMLNDLHSRQSMKNPNPPTEKQQST